jgi:heme/copper-type cytochrome/quinol oxidase subunit 2
MLFAQVAGAVLVLVLVLMLMLVLVSLVVLLWVFYAAWPGCHSRHHVGGACPATPELVRDEDTLFSPYVSPVFTS